MLAPDGGPALEAQEFGGEENPDGMYSLFDQATNGASFPNGVMVGPRDFPLGQQPDKLCEFWLRHPMMCAQADSCPFAHGLVELGMDINQTVVIRTGLEGGAIVEVESPHAHAGFGGKAMWTKPNGGPNGPWPLDQTPSGFRGKGPLIIPDVSMSRKGGGSCKGPSFPALEASQPPTITLPVPQTAAAVQGRFGGCGFMPVKICHFWMQDPNLCKKGSECSFAHGVHELQPSCIPSCGVSRFHHTGMKPTKFCSFFANGNCTRGLLCTFAHSPEEMQMGA